MVTSYGRAMVLATGSSMLVPVIGLATAPILTHSLGVAGRGLAGAAMAPNLLIVGGATLGLASALTYHLAKRPDMVRVAVAWASGVTVLLGVASLLGVTLAGDYLSDGDAGLMRLMLLGAWLAIPTLLVGLFRGAAIGRHRWSAVATERVLNSVIRLVLLSGLAMAGLLDVTNTVLVMCIAPIVAGVSYWNVLSREPVAVDPGPAPEHLVRGLLSFGSQVWLGSIATMLMARMSQLLVVPLSNAQQLGLLIVAITISDVPYILTQTVREVAFGSNSAESDTQRLLATSRVVTLVALLGSVVIGATLPLWIGFVFGSGFEASVVPTWLLLVASCVSVPGMIAGAGIDSIGRPVLKSTSLILGLVTAIVGLVVLVPPLGATGGALSALLSTLVSTGFVTIIAARLLDVKMKHFVLLQRADLAILRSVYRVVRQGVSGSRSTR